MRNILKSCGFEICLLLLFLTSCQEEIIDINDLPLGLQENQSIMVNETIRLYHLYVPENYENKPLVILLHGNRSSPDDLIGKGVNTSPHKIWLSVAEENELFLLIPQGERGSNNHRGWNDCREDANGNPVEDDVLFISHLLDSIKETYNYNEQKVYVEGISNGGQMAFRLSQEMSDQIAAIAMIAASIPINSVCQESAVPISVLMMNGTADPILPYDGGEMSSNRGLVYSAQESIDYWVHRNNISTVPISESIADINTTDGCSVTKYLFQEGEDNTEVVLYEIQGGGHTEPSISEGYGNIYLGIVGNQNRDIEMAEEVWDFFSNKSK